MPPEPQVNDCTGWRILRGSYLRISRNGKLSGRGFATQVEPTLVQYRDTKGKLRFARPEECTVVRPSKKRKHAKVLMDLDLAIFSRKAKRSRKGLGA